jgi:hypothetical protein
MFGKDSTMEAGSKVGNDSMEHLSLIEGEKKPGLNLNASRESGVKVSSRKGYIQLNEEKQGLIDNDQYSLSGGREIGMNKQEIEIDDGPQSFHDPIQNKEYVNQLQDRGQMLKQQKISRARK